MRRVLTVLAVAGALVLPAAADVMAPTAHFGVTPDQEGFQPMGWEDTLATYGQDALASSNPAGSAYAGGALIQDGINAFGLSTGPHAAVWSNGVVPIGTNAVTGAGMSMIEFYLPGVGPNGGDIIQVNVVTDDSSIWTPAGTSPSPNGVPFNSWRIDIGSTAFPDAIDFAGPEVLLSSGAAWFNDGGSLGTFALTVNSTTPNSVGGVHVVGIGGGPIDGFGLDEGALFWEITPEPSSLLLVVAGTLFAIRRR